MIDTLAPLPTMSSAHAEVLEILNHALNERRRKNRSYSIRAFARDLGLSPSFISLVFAGKRRLNLERAKSIGDRLGLSATKKNQLIKAVALARLSHETPHMSQLLTEAGATHDFSALDVDRFQYFNHWYHVAILDLATCSNFESDLSWIADRLNITRPMAAEAVERLLRLGVLKKTKAGWRKTQSYVSIPNHGPSTIVRNFHAQMIEKAKQELNKSAPEDFQRRAITGITFSIAPENIEVAKRRLASFKREMMELVEKGECTEVYQMNLQFFPLTHPRKKT